jgi:hypothetical protein
LTQDPTNRTTHGRPFTPVGNQGCRLWSGGGDLSDGKVPDHAGGWLMGINGPPPGAYEIAFVAWCRKRRWLCVRTVDLFWAFHYHRAGFPRRLDLDAARERWKSLKEERRRFAHALLRQKWRPGQTTVVIPAQHPRRDCVEQLSPAAREYLDEQHPDPGEWNLYFRRENEYFSRMRGVYEDVLHFWRAVPPPVRQAFLDCAAFSNKRPESHPDFFVAAPQAFTGIESFGWVEVKSPRDRLKPSQKKFFPELIRDLQQPVWVGRWRSGTELVFSRLSRSGDLIDCPAPFATA